MYNILVTGGNGQLGMAFKSLFCDDLNYHLIFTNSNQLDITNHDRVKEFIIEKEINTIINCAAYTSVEKAEIEQKQANAINHLAVANMAQIAKQIGIYILYIFPQIMFLMD